MPIYSYKCNSCDLVTEESFSISSDFKNQHPLCHHCGSECDYVYIPSVPQFILKDGDCGSWPSKVYRYKEYQNKVQSDIVLKQKEKYKDMVKIKPNYNGVETESWAEAKSKASEDKGAASASTYNALVEKETKK